MSDHIMWHFFLKILYRQWGNDRTSWLGDVQIRMCHSPGANHMHSEVHSDTTIWVNLIGHICILENKLELQWETKAIETFLENDPFQYWITCLFYLHLLLILWYPQPPNSMLWSHCGLCYLRNRKIYIVCGEGEKCFQDAQKLNFAAKFLSTFVAHCRLPLRLMLEV